MLYRFNSSDAKTTHGLVPSALKVTIHTTSNSSAVYINAYTMVVDKSGIKPPKMEMERKELAEKKYINGYKEEKFIILCFMMLNKIYRFFECKKKKKVDALLLHDGTVINIHVTSFVV